MPSKSINISLHKALFLLDETILQIIGSYNIILTRATSIFEAEFSSDFTFCSLNGMNALNAIRKTKSDIIFIGKDLADDVLQFHHKTFIVVKNPKLLFIKLINTLFPIRFYRYIDPTAIIAKNASIDNLVCIGPNVSIGKCHIGANSIIHGNVRIHDNTNIASNVIIHSGAIIGSDGFGYEKNEFNVLEKFQQLGGVIIESDVEIGANTTIDRGTLDSTTIGVGTKIDNLVHIAHNVKIGKYVAIIAHAMIGGSVTIKDYAWIAPSACIRDGVTIGENALVGLGAVVLNDVDNNNVVVGNPAKVIRKRGN